MTEAITTFFIFVPFIFIVYLANLADKRRLAGDTQSALAGLAYLFHIIVFGGMAAIGALLQLAGLLMSAEDLPPSVAELQTGPAAGVLDNLSLIGLGLWAPALGGLIFLLPPVRRALSRVIPIDPKSTVHAVALSFTTLIVVNLTVTLAVGLDTLANLTAENPSGGSSLILTLWTQQLTMALWALIGVGWLSRRAISQALARLGLVMPSLLQVGIGVGVGLLAVGGILLLELGISAIGFGPDENVERLTEVLLGPLLTSIPGILTLGLAAGIGEETLYRGAVQPRFGLLFTSFLFAITHSNYGITLSTLLVFLVGGLFGLLRIRFNTTTSILAHATYNSTLGLLALLAQQSLGG